MTQHRLRGHKLGVLVIPTVAALALTGCSGSTGADAGSSSKEFSLTFGSVNTVENPFQTLGKKYMETHPDVKITFNPLPNDSYDQTVRTQLQGGNASDVIITSPGSGTGRSILPLADANFLEPLADSAKKLVPVGSEALFGKDGKVYGQAPDITVVGVVTNETAAKAAGISDLPDRLRSTGKGLFHAQLVGQVLLCPRRCSPSQYRADGNVFGCLPRLR